MTRSNRGFRGLALLCAAIALPGCYRIRGPRSAYQAMYENRLVGVEVPSDQDIRAAEEAENRDLPQPVQRVWENFLDLATRSCGLLGVGDDPGGGHRALMVVGKNVDNSRVARALLIDRWLAVSLQPAGELSTRVTIAFVSPETARVAAIENDKPPRDFKLGENAAISLAASADLLLALEKSFAEGGYLEHLQEGPPPTPRGAPQNVPVKSDPKRGLLLNRHGNFTSAKVRRENFVLHFPELERRIGNVVHRLAIAAGQPGDEPRVFIVADLEVAPRMEPNGDLFLTTGTLDEARSLDELTGVIAHEMAHLYLHHGITRANSIHRAQVTGGVVLGGFMLGGAVGGGLLPTSRPKSVAPKDTVLTGKAVLIGVATSLGALYLSSQLGVGAGAGIASMAIDRFSRAEELAADDYGAELLWGAGYDYRGLLRFLEHSGHRLAAKR